MNKMKYYVVIMCLSLIGACIETEEEIKYTKIFEEEGFNIGTSILPIKDGFIILGYTFTDNNKEIWLLKIDKNEKEIWRKSCVIEEDYYTQGFLEADDGYVISGYIESLEERFSKIVLLKTDKEGEKEWQKEYTGLGHARGGAILSVEDGYILAGFTIEDLESENIGYPLIIKIDREGNKQWQKIYEDGNQTVSPICKIDDGYMMAGSKFSGADKWDLQLTKIDKNGEKIWSKTYKREGVEWPVSVFSLNDGFVIAGYSSRHGGDFLLMKVDKNGNEIWSKTYDNEDDLPRGALEIENGFIIVGVTFPDFEAEKDAFIVKTDREGNEQWQIVYGDEKDQIAYSLCGDNGGFLIVGATTAKDEGDLLLIKIE